MTKLIWNNINFITPPIGSNVCVKDSINGPVYVARWGSYGWQIISYPDGQSQVGNPLFWRN
jgi:hypothetical protein